MRRSTILVIFRREVRDQLRDRRTLFMIFVLPLLLYPILGIGVTRFGQFLTQQPRPVVIVGPEHLPDEPPLLNKTRDGFNPGLFDSAGDAKRLLVRVEPAAGPWGEPKYRKQEARARQRPTPSCRCRRT